MSDNGLGFAAGGSPNLTAALEGHVLTFAGAQVIKTAVMTGVDPRGTKLIGQDGAGYEVSDRGTGVIVASGAGNIVSAGAGNVVAQGAGN